MSPTADEVSVKPKDVPVFQITDPTHLSTLRKLCSFLSDNSLVTSTRPPLPTRYPQFQGADDAAKRVASLPEFLSAKVVLVSPGVGVMSDVVLQEDKMLVSPTPGLREDKVFQQLVKKEVVDETVSGKRGPKYQRLKLEEDVKIDLLVVGSMLVDKLGRRMGKKRDQVGMEFVLGGKSVKKAMVITLVLDCQVVEEIPESMFCAADIPVDIIVTPTKVIRVKNKLPKPDSILWSRVTQGMMESIPLLEAVRKADKEAGKDTDLSKKEEQTTIERIGSKYQDLGMGSKVKFQPLPRELKYSELREALKEKVEPGFKVGVLKFGVAVAFFKEKSEEVIEKLKGLAIDGKKVEMEGMEFVKREGKSRAVSSDRLGRKKAEMKSKFKFEKIGDMKSVDLKKALIERSVHFGFLKIFKKSGVAIVLFQEEAAEVSSKLKELEVCGYKVVAVEMVLGERREKPLKPKEARSPRSPRREKLSDMKSKFIFRNLGDAKVAALKVVLRENKAEPGFVVVYKKFGVAIVMFKEISEDMIKKLKGLTVDKNEVEFEEIELDNKGTSTRVKRISVRERTGIRKRTPSMSLKFFQQGLTGMFIGSLPRDVSENEVKEAITKKNLNAAHVELVGRKGFAFAYFDEKSGVILDKLKDLKVKDRASKVELMRTPPAGGVVAAKSGEAAIEQPKVEGIVSQEKSVKVEKGQVSEEKSRGIRKSSSSEDEKLRRKKSTSSEDESKMRRKKNSTSEEEEIRRKVTSSVKIDADVSKVKEKKSPKIRSGKKSRGT